VFSCAFHWAISSGRVADLPSSARPSGPDRSRMPASPEQHSRQCRGSVENDHINVNGDDGEESMCMMGMK
jgi:hypothetical protein